MKSIMITAPSSNTGKTLVTLGIIGALRKRGIDISAFKTGPDFIDTKYLSLASGKRAGNLDIHLMGKKGIKDSLSMNIGEMALIEGAMGYFDGIYNTFENSSYDIGRHLDIPAILVYTPKGQMFSAVAVIKGMAEFPGSRIRGLILNKTSPSMYPLLKEKVEEYTNLRVLGYLPQDKSLNMEERYLGLINPHENPKIQSQIDRLALAVEDTIDIDGVIDLAKAVDITPFRYPERNTIKVAIAYDNAFNFYYQENLNLLEHLCQVEYFSPLKDRKVPEADLIYIGGGYPELFREELSRNQEMIESIRTYGQRDGHILGEAGGLMYLSDSIEGYPMCGLIKGDTVMTKSLQRFGYVNIGLKESCLLENAGHILRGQEFHRSILKTKAKEIFRINKTMGNRSWSCGYRYKNVLGYYQHINFLGNLEAFNCLLETIGGNEGNNNVY